MKCVEKGFGQDDTSIFEVARLFLEDGSRPFGPIAPDRSKDRSPNGPVAFSPKALIRRHKPYVFRSPLQKGKRDQVSLLLKFESQHFVTFQSVPAGMYMYVYIIYTLYFWIFCVIH